MRLFMPSLKRNASIRYSFIVILGLIGYPGKLYLHTFPLPFLFYVGIGIPGFASNKGSIILQSFTFCLRNDQRHIAKYPDLDFFQIKFRHNRFIIAVCPGLHVLISVEKLTVCSDKKKIGGVYDLILFNGVIIEKIPDKLAIYQYQHCFISV